MSDRSTAVSTTRNGAFDGLRGLAILLVVLSHGWTLWPTTGIDKSTVSLDLFSSGDFAVSIFFVVGAFLATDSMLRHARRQSKLHPWVTLLRRYLRLSGQVYFLLLVVMLVTVLDTTDLYPHTETRNGFLHVSSFTWNWYLQDHALVARPDLGHLWYLSVDMQVFVLILFVVALLIRHPGWLVLSLAGILVATLAWRAHVYDTEGAYQALLRTTARMDAPIAGALAASLMPFVGRLRPLAPVLGLFSLVSLIPLAHLCRPISGYFGWPGAALDAALGLFMISCSLAPPSRLVGVPLSFRPLTVLGRRSLGIYLWHYPVFWFVSRHTSSWAWEWRTVLAFAITVVTSVASEAIVESRVRRLLASPAWHELETSTPRFLTSRAKALVGR